MKARYPLAHSTWNGTEREAIQQTLTSGLLTMGRRVQEFEELFADHFNAKYAVMVNSGSSANLLMAAALRYVSENKLLPGDEILVPAVSWGTSYFPFYQYGVKLRFVDIDLDTLNYDLDQLEAAITPQTKAILAVNLLGSANDFDRLQAICDKHQLILLEDNCESMGAEFNGQFTGTFGRMGTFSLFFSHHLCTIEGGMILTNEKELFHLLLSLRSHGWTRHLPAQNLIEDKVGNSFHDAFRFVLPGYNVRPTEINGAIGVEQLKKLSKLLEERRSNAERFQGLFGDCDYFRTQRPIGNSSWFGFSMICEGALKGRRDELVNYLISEGIECRPIVAGEFTKNPACDYMEHSVYGELTNAQSIDREGFFVGNQHLHLGDELVFIKQRVERFVGLEASIG